MANVRQQGSLRIRRPAVEAFKPFGRRDRDARCRRARAGGAGGGRGVNAADRISIMLKIEIEREDDGRWIGEVPEPPGVLAYGASEDHGHTP